jgi:hypothetical protein
MEICHLEIDNQLQPWIQLQSAEISVNIFDGIVAALYLAIGNFTGMLGPISLLSRAKKLSYAVNGQPVNDFPLTNTITFLAAGLACLAAAGFVLATRRSEPLMLDPLP